METLLIQQILLINLVLFGYVQLITISTSMKCDFNRDVCDSAYCLLLNGRGKLKYMSAGCNFVKPIKAATVEVDILRRNKFGEYKSMNMKALVDVCRLESTIGGNGIINNIISMSMHSLSSIKCPLRGNITITRMPLTFFIVEGFLAQADYKIFSKLNSGALSVLSLNISFSVISAKN